MTARKTAKPAKRPAAKTTARKRVAKPQARPVAAIEPKAGAKVPPVKVAAAIALARRKEGVTLDEVAKSQGWNVRASQRHLDGWASRFGYRVTREVAAGQVRFHMAPLAA